MDLLKATLTSLFLRKTTGVCVGALLACSALSHAQAGVSAEEIKKLGDTLTPYGAEKAGLKVNFPDILRNDLKVVMKDDSINLKDNSVNLKENFEDNFIDFRDNFR